MSRFIEPVESREQLVLFSRRLDDAIPQGHQVRLLDEILGQVDWSAWEAKYVEGGPGRNPFHPRVMASLILYGVLNKVRASRVLEQSLLYRIDFRWLAQGLSIDHTTLSEFRRKNGEELKDLFVQIVVIAHQTGLVSFTQLAFDGTRIRASNHRHRTRTPVELRTLQKELTKKFDEYLKQAEQEEEAEQFSSLVDSELPKELADTKRRLAQIKKAIKELDRLEAAEKKLPKRLPLTDPESRVLPNKEGGMAANYNPTCGVDTQSGIILTSDVLSETSEEHELVAAVEQVKKDFGESVQSVLADSLFGTGENLKAMEDRKITLYSPLKGESKTPNPAIREELSEPVPQEKRSDLPTRLISKKKNQRQLDKAAFVYDANQNCYWCPQGKSLFYEKTTSEKNVTGTRVYNRRYKAKASDCAACPLKSLCLSKTATSRTVRRDQFEPQRENLAKRMRSDAGKTEYAKRGAPGERPFGGIKQHFGVRQFLLRGLDRVRIEWDWLSTGFNIKLLMGHLSRSSRAGPTPA